MKKMTCLGVLLLFALVISGARTTAIENRTRPGELFSDPPTLINLGFEWRIEGDDNRNAKVEVSYRKQGETQWKRGLPLLRLQGEQIYQGQGVFNVVSPNMFAGSIFDLEPNTLYEALGSGRLTWTGRESVHSKNKRTHPPGTEALSKR